MEFPSRYTLIMLHIHFGVNRSIHRKSPISPIFLSNEYAYRYSKQSVAR